MIAENDKKVAPRPTKAQIEERVKVVYIFLLSDTPRIDIVQYAAKTWKIKTRASDNLIEKANALIVEEAARMRQNALEKHLAQRALIRHNALKNGDERLAFDVLKDETKLLDLYPSPTNKNLNIDLNQLTDEQLERIANGDDPLAVITTSGKSQT